MDEAKQKRFRIAVWLKRFFKFALWSFVAWFVIVLVGLISVNNSFQETEEGIEIFVSSNEVHADIIVPVSTKEIDWSESFADTSFAESISGETHVAFGWGDKGFFLETETWDDFKISTAANALLLPSESCMHVTFTRPDYYSDASSVTISSEQYRLLVEHIENSFSSDSQDEYLQIEGYAYSGTDAFFEAKGRYHILNTCNSWVGRGLRAAGVRVPWLSPLPKTPMLYFDDN